MKIEKLYYFLSVAKHLNFTRAAQECHIAQPAISEQISSLERELGVQLFERGARSIRLTAAGEVFYQNISRFVQNYEQSLREVRTSLQETKAEYMQTDAISSSAYLPNIIPGTRVHLGFLIAVAAAVAVLAVSVSAAVLWLSPSEVADRVEEPLLAEAFQGDDAIVLDESMTAGDYQITLAGMVSGEDLSVPTDYNGEIISDRTYAVFRVARADGAPLTDYPDLSYSPLVDGYHVSCVNAWTLGTTTQQFIEDGVIYCLFDCRNLEMFADHPVRFAIYEGGVPNTDLFSMAEDGTISLRENVVGVLFTLPLDESRADPAAAKAFVESTGLFWEPVTDAELAEQEAAGSDTLEALCGVNYRPYIVETITMQMENRMAKNPEVVYFPIREDRPLTDYVAIDETTAFTLDEDGNIVATGVTDKNGIAIFTLRYGKYTYQEYNAPEGYKIDESEYAFEIKEDGQIVKATMTNEKIPEELITTPKTGDDSRPGLWIGLSALSGAGVAAFGILTAVKMRKRKEEDKA